MNSAIPELKKGFTTGTCAQAAAKGACIMLETREPVDEVNVETPSGAWLKIGLVEQYIGKDFARCAVIKDAGDDIDVTDGAKICAEVRISEKKGVAIRGAEGVGKVTKPGLAIGIGECAINPVPRQMIIKEIEKIMRSAECGVRNDEKNENSVIRIPNSTFERGIEVIISVPGGKEMAKHTFNPRLGIVGGISIIGTTGIVEPKSLDAYKASLSLELNVLKSEGYKKVIFVLGYVGEKFCKEVLKLKEEPVINPSTRLRSLRINGECNRTIKIGDYVGFMLEECVKRKIPEILLIGHIGKLIKVANGQFNTHYKFGDNRVNSIARYAKLCGADNNVVKDILGQDTAEATIEILRKGKIMRVFDRISQDVLNRLGEFVKNKVIIDCIILSLQGEVIGAEGI